MTYDIGGFDNDREIEEVREEEVKTLQTGQIFKPGE